MMAKKMCEICRKTPATVPDRECFGRLVNRVCNSCHALRLAGDLKHIVKMQNAKNINALGRPISREEALRIARQTLDQAERERLEVADREAARGV